ncbi:hypothetical protein [Roseomonas indoligenes]|uniref:Lipoprotein n=1 Tax=Roseomonas indoligenes TaxID=2820811 RepID=A0A940MPT5_9PROT|nr:hypothetical protein [Pararoseomonas indoligenes]MBP0491269.1 hypothetical protein [Pararoseomonas indoligenes]
MRFLPVVLALLLLTGCAGTGDSAPASRSTPQEEGGALPVEFDGFRRVGNPLNFEGQPGGAGLGAGVRYAPANGERIALTVYIYDRGRPRAPEGGASPDVLDELRTTTAELNAAVRAGIYRSVKFNTGMNLGQGNVPTELRCLNFSMVQRDGTPTGDSVCVTVVNGRFMKVRLTVSTPPEPVMAGVLAIAILQRFRGLGMQNGTPASGLRT